MYTNYIELRKKFPDRKIFVYYMTNGHQDVFLNNPHIDVVKPLRIKSVLFKPTYLLTFLSWKFPRNRFLNLFKRWRVEFIEMHHNHVPISWAYQKSVIDIVLEIFKLQLTDRKIQLFITDKENDYAKEKLKGLKNVIFLHILPRSSKNRRWQLNKWSELVKSLPDFTFIQFGQKNEPYIEGALDWRDKLSYKEALAILKHCLSFVGVDSSFAHATNAFDLPGVVLFGDSSPIYWGHKNNINIYKIWIVLLVIMSY